MAKKDFKEYEKLMKQKFDWEDEQVRVYNEKQKLNREALHVSHELRKAEDELRDYFNRVRIEVEKAKKE